MFEIIALVFTVFLLLQLQRLRALLSFVFPLLQARRIARPHIPDAIADLHTQAASELETLGFDGPTWYRVDTADGSLPAQPVAAWRQRHSADALWLYPPQSAASPDRLVAVFVRRLADGRHAVSQAYDAYAEIVASEQVVAQTIGGADLAAQWRLHQDWCARLGAADLGAVEDAALDWQAAALHNERIAVLLEHGRIYRDSHGLLRPRLALAWRMYRAIVRHPKAPPGKQPLSPARLAWLAQITQRQTLQPVPRRVQAGLFGFSVVLFLVLGGWFWGLRFAAILFVVVAIHELGHYLAMRLAGYRNVQMLALPLVGGVTMGHEAKPDAARRAWMSLMGPLPGILIGWGLLFYAVLQGQIGDGLAYEAALVFLFVNYLNVLPVPPLDGAHVVQELLPVGSARLSAVFVACASLAGAALAFWLGFNLLAVIALLQLPASRYRWQLGGVLRALRDSEEREKSRDAALRRRRVFEVFDRVAGATNQAPLRLALAAEALRSFEVKPMRLLQRCLVGGTYLVLLAGPVLVAIVAIGQWRSNATIEVDFDAIAQRHERNRQQMAQRAAALDTRELLLGIAASQAILTAQKQPAALAAPADAADLTAAEQRLGQALPDELLAFYRVADGDVHLPVSPAAQLRFAAATADLELEHYAYAGRIEFSADAAAPISATPAELQRMLLLGRDTDLGTVLLYDIAPQPQQTGVRYYYLDSEGSNEAGADLMSALRRRWSANETYVLQLQRSERTQAREQTVVAGWTPSQLLDALERPVWWMRLINPQLAWPGPADADAVAAVAQRFGAPLPADLAEIYRRHDGIPALHLLPLADWQPMGELRGAPADTATAQVSNLPGIDAASLHDCIVIAGLRQPELLSANLLWCPRHAPSQQYVDLWRSRSWSTYTELLRTHVALTRAARRGTALAGDED